MKYRLLTYLADFAIIYAQFQNDRVIAMDVWMKAIPWDLNLWFVTFHLGMCE